MMHPRRFFFLLLILPLCLIACGTPAQTHAVLTAMCSSQSTLPAGQVYHMEAVPGEAEYAEDELLSVLYGNGSLPSEFEVINDFSIRLCGFAEPYELAVFRCVSTRDAYDVAQMCLRRADRIQISCRETPYSALVDNARVCILGKYVLMAICDDPLSAIAAGRQAAR